MYTLFFSGYHIVPTLFKINNCVVTFYEVDNLNKFASDIGKHCLVPYSDQMYTYYQHHLC